MPSNRDDTEAGLDPTSAVLDRLFGIVTARRDERPEGSYVVGLLDGGWEAIEAKVREEAQEGALGVITGQHTLEVGTGSEQLGGGFSNVASPPVEPRS